MKNKTKFLKAVQSMAIIAVIAIIGFSVFGCDPDKGNESTEDFDIAGTYTYSQALQSGGTLVYTWVFNTDKTHKITQSIGSNEDTGTWVVSGNEITITMDSKTVGQVTVPSYSETFTITENGNWVILTLKGDSQASTVLVRFSIAGTSITLKKEIIYNVTFNTNGGTPVPSNQEIKSGSYITQPTVFKNGYELIGWYREETFINQWNFKNNTVNSDITLYAKWGVLTTFYAIQTSASNWVTAIRTDGSLWEWEKNSFGDVTTTCWSTPSRIETDTDTDTDWVSVSQGYSHTVAIKTDGTLWVWGANYYGQLGDGTTTRYTPTKIGSSDTWTSVSAGGRSSTVGESHTVAIKADGTLWIWGWAKLLAPTQIFILE